MGKDGEAIRILDGVISTTFTGLPPTPDSTHPVVSNSVKLRRILCLQGPEWSTSYVLMHGRRFTLGAQAR